MTAPIINANLTSPNSATSREGRPRAKAASQERSAKATATQDTVAVRTAAEPAADNGLTSPEQAQALLARTKQLLAASPNAGVAAHGGIDPEAVAGRLHRAA